MVEMDVQKNELHSIVVVSSSSESEPEGSEELADKSTLERILGKPSTDKESTLRRKLLERKSQLTEAKLRKKLLSKRTPVGEIRTKVDFEDEHLAHIPLPPESDNSMEIDVELKNFEDLTEEEKPMLSPTLLNQKEEDYQRRLCARLPIYYPGISGCRSIEEFKIENKIEEGTFGVVYRAVEERTDEVVALKRLKMEKEKDGFPITSLREINMLMKCRNHPNVVGLKEVVIGSTMDKIYLVMEFVEHDLKSLMKQFRERKKSFTMPQVKSLMHQLLSGCAYIHNEWILHRDIKTSNLLLTRNNVLKIADFGLAREYGDPLKAYTPVVVTLWYRSPELLLGTKKYSTAIDIWSIGCIFGEFFKLTPIFQGTSETDQLNKIFMDIGTPNETVWPGYKELPGVARCVFANTPYNQLRKKFMGDLKSELGLELMNRFLAPCPERRISAEAALKHEFFNEPPKAAALDSFPTFPAKSENKNLSLRQNY